MAVYKDVKTGKWYCQFYYIDWQGKRRHTSKRGFLRKKDAEEWESKNKFSIKTDNISMSTLLAAYKDHLNTRVQIGTLKENTRAHYCDVIDNHIAPYFQDMDMKKVTTTTINKWIMSLHSQRPDIAKLSNNTINSYKKRLTTVFSFAMKEYGLERNPVTNSESLKSESSDKRAKLWSLDEYKRFYAQLNREDYKLAFNLMYWAGLRIGEVMALKPMCFDKHTVTINETKTRIGNKMYFTSPKTPASKRVVAIPQFLYYQAMNYIARIPYLETDETIFKFNRDSLRNRLKMDSKKLNLPYISPHILRHSYASLLLNLTKDATVVSKQIGHANPNVTLSVYSHMLPGEDSRAAEKLNDLAINPQTIDSKIENPNK